MGNKFICNGMLGKLCKLLRICGIDTVYSNQGITILLGARKEGRIILTRNTKLRGKDGVFFVESNTSGAQLKNVIDAYKLQNEIKLFSRCLICNETLISVDKDSIRNKIPYFTYKKFDEFACCPKCERIYWHGSHYNNMIRKLEKLYMQPPMLNSR